MNLYKVKLKILDGTTYLVVAKNFDVALLKANKILARENKELKESDDARYPDELGSISFQGEVDE